MKRTWTLMTAGLLLVLAAQAAKAQTAPTPVSIVNLISTPERYAGTRVRVVGFAAVDGALYMNADDARIGNTKNAIALSNAGNIISEQTRTRAQFRNAVVEGTFRNTGGLYSGTIDSITLLDRWTEAPQEPGAAESTNSSP